MRLALYRILWLRTEATIQAAAEENSTFIESVRAIQSLKLFNRESEREGQWLNRYAEVANANVRLGRTKIAFSTLNELIFGLETVVVVYLAARLALGNQLTVGMIFAFMSYKQHFTDKAVQLVEKALDLRMLGLHLERLSDIALTPLEPGHDQALAYTRPIEGRIELRQVCFRYSETDPFVLEDVNLTVEPGEFVTIMGPSGGGKTTLMKLMLGLLEPTSGEVLIDGAPLPTIGARAYREQVAAVMQEDQLLSGSIADNICFFDPEFDEERMTRCAAARRHPRRDHGHADDVQQPRRRHGQLALRRPEATRAAGARPLPATAHPRSWTRARPISTWTTSSISTRASHGSA